VFFLVMCARNPCTSDSVKTVKLFLRYVGQWRCSSTLFLTSALPLGKSHLYPLNRMQTGLQDGFGRFGEEQILWPLPGIEHRRQDHAVPR
jgi:hypothetical protein